MKKPLIALAIAGCLASGVAVAGTTSVYATGDLRPDGFISVQYYSGDRSDRSDDRIEGVNEREARIKARIQRGIESGAITDGEARRLYGELRGIEAKERALRADGRLNGREAAELNRDLDQLADDVREQRRDDQRRDEPRRY